MKTFTGYRVKKHGSGEELGTYTCLVRVQEQGKLVRPLLPRNDLRDHSPTGFEWGYHGSGPAQLALALVVECLGDSYALPAIYQHVKRKLVANLPSDGWTLTEEQILAAVWTADCDRKTDVSN